MYGFQFPSVGDRARLRNVGDEFFDLDILECIAQFFHRGLRHTVLNDAGDVLVGVAVDPTIIGQVGAFAAAAGPAVTSGAQAPKQGLALRQSSRIWSRNRGGRFGGCRALCAGAIVFPLRFFLCTLRWCNRITGLPRAKAKNVVPMIKQAASKPGRGNSRAGLGIVTAHALYEFRRPRHALGECANGQRHR